MIVLVELARVDGSSLRPGGGVDLPLLPGRAPFSAPLNGDGPKCFALNEGVILNEVRMRMCPRYYLIDFNCLSENLTDGGASEGRIG